MPPEMLSGESNAADPSIDVWAIGVIMFQMLYGDYPFNGIDKNELKKAIISSELRFPYDIPVTPDAKSLMLKLLEKRPEKRMSMLDFESHKWFSYM